MPPNQQAIDLLVSVLVIVGFGLWAYSKYKGQSIKDTVDEIRLILQGT